MSINIDAINAVFPSQPISLASRESAKLLTKALVKEAGANSILKLAQDIETDLFIGVDANTKLGIDDAIPNDNKYDLIFSSVPWRRTDPSLPESEQQSIIEFLKASVSKEIVEVEKATGSSESKDKYPFINKAKSYPKTNASFYSYELILKVCEQLSKDGLGLFNIHPLGFRQTLLRNYYSNLIERGIYINGYLNFSYDGLDQVIAVISRTKKNQYVATVLGNIDCELLSKDLLKNDETFEVAQQIQEDSFIGFKAIDTARRIDRLNTRFNEYEKCRFSDLVEFSDTYSFEQSSQMSDLDNCIYVKLKSGSNHFYTAFDELERPFTSDAEDQYFTQIQLKTEVTPNYIKHFFKTEIGQLIIDTCCMGSLYSGSPNIDLEILMEQTVPVPSTKTQLQVASSIGRLETIENNLQLIKSELALHPESKSVREKLDEMLLLSGQLTKGDKIKSLVLGNETKGVEFKSTFQLCLRSNEQKDYITHSALKTIAGFLNTDGGMLLVGVADDGRIPGVNDELRRFFKSSEDKYLLYVQDKINSALGYKALSNVKLEFIEINGAAVLEVSCKSVDERDVFMNGKEYFARVPAGTKKLEGKEILNHIKQKE